MQARRNQICFDKMTAFFNLAIALAQLSRSLISWAYRIGRPPSSSTLFKHLLFRNHWANQSNFIWSFYGMGEQKFAQTVLVTWPRWPPYLYMVKTLKNLLLQNQKADDLETCYASLGVRVLPIFSNGAPGLTLTYFTARSNMVPYAFIWEKGKTMDFS